jgi:tetratricopeptide (TPR) repeat protein
VFEELGDEAGLGRALGLDGQLRFWRGEAAAALELLERAAAHSESAGDRVQQTASLGYVLLVAEHGPTPAPAAIELADRTREVLPGSQRHELSILRCTSYLHAILGNFDVARERALAATTLADSFGLEFAAAGSYMETGRVEMVAGDLEAAEGPLRTAFDRLDAIGDRGYIVTVAPILADVLIGLGRPDEAEPLLEYTAEWAMAEDLDPQIAWRRVKARLLARRGELEEALRLAAESVEIAAGTDYIDDHARALEVLGEALRLAGWMSESTDALERALALYEQKGNTVSVERMRTLLAS